MKKYIAQRALRSLITVALVFVAVFMLLRFMPLEGYFSGPIAWPLRIICAAGGLCLIFPGAVTDIIGLVTVGGVALLQYLRSKSAQKAAA